MTESKVATLNPQLAGGDARRRVRMWPNAAWVEKEIQQLANGLKEGDTIAEVGIGAGSYARAVSAPGAIRVTVDLPMQNGPRPWRWPLSDDSVDLLISVDGLHYESDVESFVKEAARITRTTKLFVVFTRAKDDLAKDGLAKFFPHALERSLPLVPETPVLEKLLEQEGLYCSTRTTVGGQLQIDELLLRAIAHRELTGLSTLSDEEFTRGVDEMKAAVGRGETAWDSQFTMLICRKVRPWKTNAAPSMGMGKM